MRALIRIAIPPRIATACTRLFSDGSNSSAAFHLVRAISRCYCPTRGVCVSPCSLMPTKALVVDDSMLIRYTVCRYLEDRGFTVESATNGAEAMDVLSRMHVDLIFTDMQMPKMSGSEFITQLKNKPETAKVPI